MKKVLIIEGTNDRSNGDLRQGFHKLLSQKVKNRMPRIIMGEGKSQAIKKFINHKVGIPNLLIDLDMPENKKREDINRNNLNSNKEYVFYMIQEMEAWFLSQPDILNSFYKDSISKNIPKRNVKDISKPSDLLYRITKSSKKGKYHKVSHGVELLKMLDAKKLIDEFDDFRNLIDTLNN